jgi:hypothetical protein
MRANVLEKNIGGGIYTIDHNCGASASQTVDIPSDAPANGYAIACLGNTNTNGTYVESCSVSGSVITVTLGAAAAANDDLTVMYFGDVGAKSAD